MEKNCQNCGYRFLHPDNVCLNCITPYLNGVRCGPPSRWTPSGAAFTAGTGGGSNEQHPYITPYKPFTGNGASVEPIKKVVQFQSYNVSMGEAVEIFKFRLDDPNIAHQSKLLAIEKVSNMETHNSITKDDLVKALRWLFERYDFEGAV